MAAAAASFRIVILSISLGLMFPIPFTKMLSNPPVASCSLLSDGESLCIGTPSTTQSGALVPVILLDPRIVILDCVPGCPERDLMLTPATSPCIRASTDDIALASNLSALSTATEPVIRFTEVCAYPVTTTWSNWLFSHSRMIFTSSVLPGIKL